MFSASAQIEHKNFVRMDKAIRMLMHSLPTMQISFDIPDTTEVQYMAV
jgi:hypothetical protein